MGKLTLKIKRRRLSVSRRAIRKALDEVLSLPDSEFDFENPQIPIVTKRLPPRKNAVKKVKSKTTAAKKPASKKSTKR